MRIEIIFPIFVENIEKMRIKSVIKERGLTSAEVARRMGVVPEALSRVVNGNPTIAMLERVAKAIGCPISELLDTEPQALRCPHCGRPLELLPK